MYRARESALEEHKLKEEWAELKATEIVKSHSDDIHQIVRYLQSKIKHVNDSCNAAATAAGTGGGGANTHADGSGATGNTISNNNNNNNHMNNHNHHSNGTTTGGSSSISRYNELVAVFRSAASGLAKVESNILIARLINGNPTNNSTNSNTPSRKHSRGHATENTTPVAAAAAHHHTTKQQQSNNNNKSYRSHFTAQELFAAVYETRKLTIMRGLMEELDSTATLKMLLNMLHAEATRLRAEGRLHIDSTYLPVKSCFTVLESAQGLRLTRPQIIFIISWADCFDKEGCSVDIERFAEHAANIIPKLSVTEMLESRAEIVANNTFDEKKVLNGLREADLEKHIETALASVANSGGRVTQQQLAQVLKGIPKLNLSEREAATIAATLTQFDHKPCSLSNLNSGNTVNNNSSSSSSNAAPVTDATTTTTTPTAAVETVAEPVVACDWHDLVASAVRSTITLCRERLINRRVSLHVTSSSVPASRNGMRSSSGTQSRNNSNANSRGNTRDGNSNSSHGLNRNPTQSSKAMQQQAQNQLKQLAEKLLNIVKIQLQVGYITN